MRKRRTSDGGASRQKQNEAHETKAWTQRTDGAHAGIIRRRSLQAQTKWSTRHQSVDKKNRWCACSHHVGGQTFSGVSCRATMRSRWSVGCTATPPLPRKLCAESCDTFCSATAACDRAAVTAAASASAASSQREPTWHASRGHRTLSGRRSDRDTQRGGASAEIACAHMLPAGQPRASCPNMHGCVLIRCRARRLSIRPADDGELRRAEQQRHLLIA